VTPTVIPQVSDGTQPAIHNHYEIHYHGQPDADPAAIIRAIPGQAGDAITSEEK